MSLAAPSPESATPSAGLAAPSAGLAAAIAEFDAPRGYLSTASIGLPCRATLRALRDDLDRWAAARLDPAGYDAVVDRTRESYARLVGVPATSVAIGSQTSVIGALVAAALPAGAEVLAPAGEFASTVLPFMAAPGVRVRFVELDELVGAIGQDTALVAFSHIQSATGAVADVSAIAAAAEQHGTLTYCDVTQSAGVHPVDAGLVDYTVCHAYKWLCSPRGVAFLTVSDRAADRLTPLQASWYAADEVWALPYVPGMKLAPDARRFDVAPAWQAFVGADPAIALFAALDMAEVWARASGLGDLLCRELGIPEQHQAIVTWPDASGDDLRKLTEAGIRVAGRAGRLRAAFHLYNDESDVEAVVRVVR